MRLLTLIFCLAALARGQAPVIGIIDYYGLHKLPAERVRRVLGVKEGDRLPSSKADVEERLEAVPGIVQAWLEATCCEDGKAVLYVGVEERGAAHFDVHDVPATDLDLPAEIGSAYQRFLESLQEAVRKQETAEDLRQGHSLLANQAARAVQLEFVDLAEKHLVFLRTVLRGSSDETQRAIAAYVIGYAPDKKAVVDDLQYAMRDPDPTVRSNAMRDLIAIAAWAAENPRQGVRVSYTWFTEMLNSLYWTDRNSAAIAMANFTEKRDQAALDQLRERALPSLLEMARWKHLPHALPAFILVGRIAGLEEKDIQDAWSKGDRERVFKALLRKPGGQK